MTTFHNNNIREDAVFKFKVKDVLLRHGGTGGLVNALLAFNAREAAAVCEQSRVASGDGEGTSGATGSSYSSSSASPTDGGLTYDQFLQYLSDFEVELTPFEARYLCQSFDDHGNGYISAATFTRHLTGLNERRLRAVRKAWQILERRGGVDGEVPRDVLLSTYASVAAERSRKVADDRADAAAVAADVSPDAVEVTTFSSPLGAALASTFGSPDSTREQLRESYLASLMTRGDASCPSSASGAPGSDAAERVSYAEFVAFYAGVSRQFGTDESFVSHILKSWAADDASCPTLNETERVWGPNGDPLALDGPWYVKDALNQSLGITSKSYNYSHMQRVSPYVAPLPPLDRPELMVSTVQRTFVRYDAAGQTLANPLATRRGQEM